MANLPAMLRDAIRRPWYYTNSAWIRTYRQFSSHAFFDRAVYARTSDNLSDYDSIVFAFDSRMIHIGDQLFFLPLIFKLVRHGYPVEIDASSGMSRIYPPHLMNRRIGKRPLFVSRLPVLPDIRKRAGSDVDFFVVDGHSPGIEEPIGLFTLRSFCHHFGLATIRSDLDNQERAQLALPIALPHSFEALKQKKTIILSNYIDSGKYRRSPATAAKIVEDAKRYKDVSGGFVVHVGTVDDRKSDPISYQGLVDLDLRGKTSISDLFGIFCHVPVDMVFTFDTAILHLARMYGRPVRHYWRQWRSMEQYLRIKRAHVHFFDRDAISEC